MSFYFKRTMKGNESNFRAVVVAKKLSTGETKEYLVGPYRSKGAVTGQINQHVNRLKRDFKSQWSYDPDWIIEKIKMQETVDNWQDISDFEEVVYD